MKIPFWPIASMLNSSMATVFGEEIYGRDPKTRKERVVRRWIAHKIFIPINNAVWAFKYRYVPKHQYNIVRTDLKPAYYDIDDVMLHANMALLCRYVEIEREGEAKLQERADWLHTYNDDVEHDWQKMGEEGMAAEDEPLAIYHWWKYERAACWKRYDDMLHERYGKPELRHTTKPVDIEGNEVPEDEAVLFEMVFPPEPETGPTSKDVRDLEEALHAKDEEMLIRLMIIRRSLWS